MSNTKSKITLNPKVSALQKANNNAFSSNSSSEKTSLNLKKGIPLRNRRPEEKAPTSGKSSSRFNSKSSSSKGARNDFKDRGKDSKDSKDYRSNGSFASKGKKRSFSDTRNDGGEGRKSLSGKASSLRNNRGKRDKVEPLQKNTLLRKRRNLTRNKPQTFDDFEFDPSYYFNPRYQAALIIYNVLEKRQSLTIDLKNIIEDKDIGFTSELAFGVIRYLPQLNFIANKLLNEAFEMDKPLAQIIMLQALYQIIYLNRADHAAVYEAVELTKKVYGHGVAKVMNACLRSFLRNEEELIAQSLNVELLPGWLNKKFTARYDKQTLATIKANINSRPPFWLRINTSKVDVEEYLSSLPPEMTYFQHPAFKQAFLLENSCPVEEIPGFMEGLVSVQDLHAQISSLILVQEVADGKLLPKLSKPQLNTLKGSERALELSANVESLKAHKESTNQELTEKEIQSRSKPLIVDSCSAPGGKTTHLLDLIPHANLIATEIDSKRAERTLENLERLGQEALLLTLDACYPEPALDEAILRLRGKEFKRALSANQLEESYGKVDLMLLDIPCSATGVIRRHPDIKWLRKPYDIEKLHSIQLEILEKMWKYLAVGGKLLYTSCSLLGEENEEVVKEFLNKVDNAQVIDLKDFSTENIAGNSIINSQVDLGLQVVNSEKSGDGFYYCLLTKKA